MPRVTRFVLHFGPVLLGLACVAVGLSAFIAGMGSAMDLTGTVHVWPLFVQVIPWVGAMAGCIAGMIIATKLQEIASARLDEIAEEDRLERERQRKALAEFEAELERSANERAPYSDPRRQRVTFLP